LLSPSFVFLIDMLVFRDCTEQQLQHIFRKYGQIEVVTIKDYPDKRVAFIHYTNVHDARKAINDRILVGNELLQVSFAIQHAHPPLEKRADFQLVLHNVLKSVTPAELRKWIVTVSKITPSFVQTWTNSRQEYLGVVEVETLALMNELRLRLNGKKMNNGVIHVTDGKKRGNSQPASGYISTNCPPFTKSLDFTHGLSFTNSDLQQPKSQQPIQQLFPLPPLPNLRFPFPLSFLPPPPPPPPLSLKLATNESTHQPSDGEYSPTSPGYDKVSSLLGALKDISHKLGIPAAETMTKAAPIVTPATIKKSIEFVPLA
jgi:hypothetical protein